MTTLSDRLQKEAVLRVGAVSAVTGRKVFVSVDTDKNLSELFYDGDVLRNIAVGSYVDIRKGFLSLIGRVEGENARIEGVDGEDWAPQPGRRTLAISLVGFLDRQGQFFGGTKELPLVGNEAFLLTKEKVHQVHCLVAPLSVGLDVAKSEYESYDIALPVDGLMNSYIAIFGNTGSGKSNTLAMLYQEFIAQMRARNADAFAQNSKILLFDFNNEFTGANCLTAHKRVYDLSTRNDNGSKLPLGADGLSDIEIVSILSDATDKTQKPFLKRALAMQRRALAANAPTAYVRGILHRQIKAILVMSDKLRIDLLLDYLRQILPDEDADGAPINHTQDLEWFAKSAQFRLNGQAWLNDDEGLIEGTLLYQAASQFNLANDAITSLISFCYIQLSYIDRLTEESIPTLPTGTCIFSGVAGQMPLKLAIRPLEKQLQPRSDTIKFQDLVPAVPVG